jgi:hypothetical protein
MIEELAPRYNRGRVEAATSIIGAPDDDIVKGTRPATRHIRCDGRGNEASSPGVEGDGDICSPVHARQEGKRSVVMPGVASIEGHEGSQDRWGPLAVQLRCSKQVARIARVDGQRRFDMVQVAVMTYPDVGNRDGHARRGSRDSARGTWCEG